MANRLVRRTIEEYAPTGDNLGEAEEVLAAAEDMLDDADDLDDDEAEDGLGDDGEE